MSIQLPVIPLEIRLHQLEAITHGRPAAQALFDAVDRVVVDKPLARHSHELEEGVIKAAEYSESLKTFVKIFDQYRPLLLIPNATSTSTQPSDASGDDAPQSYVDLLPDGVKATLLLEAAADIQAVERDLREMELLKKREVEGAGSLEDLLPLKPQLRKAVTDTETQKADMNQNQDGVARLLARYNNYTSTATDLFLDVHARIEALEDVMTRLERKKRNEEASKY